VVQHDCHRLTPRPHHHRHILLGPPEATGGQSQQPAIWKYGNVEFYFDQAGGLNMIHLDTFDGPDNVPVGWGGLQLEPGIIRCGLPLEEFLEVMGSGQLREEPELQRVVVAFPSGVEVGFTADDGLFALWCIWRHG
jgi:hypothetical protein